MRFRMRAVVKDAAMRGGPNQPLEFAYTVVSHGPVEFPDDPEFLNALFHARELMVTITDDLTVRSDRAQAAHEDAMDALDASRAGAGIGWKQIQDAIAKHHEQPD